MSTTSNLTNLSRWRCIGPFRGGRVVAVAGGYRNKATFYFGAVGGGVWKTTDAGTYWQCVTDGYLKTSSVGALAVCPADDNVIYAGMGESTIRLDVSHGDGVYKSTDAGRSWQHLGLEDTRHIGKVRVHPQNPDIVWVAALGHAFGRNEERGVFKSDDGGKTWRKTLYVSDKAGAVDLSVDESNPRIVYATIWEAYRNFWQISTGGPDCGLWRSFDGGETWEDITRNPGLPEGMLGKMGVSASPARSGRVWAIIEHKTEGGLYRSDDFGETWKIVSDNQDLISRAWYYQHVTADPVDPDTVWVNNLKFWKSTDGGRTFEEIPTGHGDNHDLWIDPEDNQRMIQGNDGGAGVSLNGGRSFTTLYNQPTAQFYHIAATDEDDYVVYGTQQDNTSLGVPTRVPEQFIDAAGIRWGNCYPAGTGESGYIAVKPDDNDIIFVGAIGSSGGGGNALQRYDHRTKQIRMVTSWPEVNKGLGAKSLKQRFSWTYPIVFSPHDANTLYIAGDRVLRSTNEGQSWEAISPDLTRADPETLEPTGGPVNFDDVGAETYATVFAFAESPLQQGLFWAGSDDGLIHISRNNGESWENITPPMLPERTLISMIEPSPFDAATAYVAATKYKLDDTTPYLYVTRDYGDTWQLITDGIPDDDFTRVIRADPAQQGLLYAGTETGVYVSFNDGVTWQPFQLNLPVSPIYDLIVHNNDLIAGTHGRSIWILDDLSAVREMAAGIADDVPYLVKPRDTIRIPPAVSFTEVPARESISYARRLGGGMLTSATPEGEIVVQGLDFGENPPKGVVITYRLLAEPEEPIELRVLKADGTVIRTFTSRNADDGYIAKERRITAKPGWNRFVWDMRHQPSEKIEGKDPIAGAAVSGPLVAPGDFKVELQIGDTVLSEDFRIVPRRDATATPEQMQEQEALLLRIHEQTNRMVKAINAMRDLRQQLDTVTNRGDDPEQTESAKALRARVLEIEEKIAVPDLRGGWGDSGNTGDRLWQKFAALPFIVQPGDYPPTDVSYQVFDDFVARIDDALEPLDSLVEKDLKDVNETLARHGLGTVVPRPHK